MTDHARDDAVLPFTRRLAAFIAPFLVVAFVVLDGFPGRTRQLFAWTITPTMTPMLLGSVYLGGAYFFLQAYRATAWHTIKAGFLSVTAFASLLGVATIVHWDRFSHDHVAFWLWAGLYFGAPFLVASAWLANRRTEPAASPDELRLPPVARVVVAAVGAMAIAMGGFLTVAPARAIRIWPWALTPLTARVLGAVFVLGLAGLGALLDDRWSSARLMVQVSIVMLVLILISAARAHDQLDGDQPLTWLLLGGFAATLAGAVGLSVVMDRRGPAGG